MPKTMKNNKLIKLSKRADKIKNDPALRHIPNEHDIRIISENTRIMHHYQYETVKTEGSDENGV